MAKKYPEFIENIPHEMTVRFNLFQSEQFQKIVKALKSLENEFPNMVRISINEYGNPSFKELQEELNNPEYQTKFLLNTASFGKDSDLDLIFNIKEELPQNIKDYIQQKGMDAIEFQDILKDSWNTYKTLFNGLHESCRLSYQLYGADGELDDNFWVSFFCTEFDEAFLEDKEKLTEHYNQLRDKDDIALNQLLSKYDENCIMDKLMICLRPADCLKETESNVKQKKIK